jgi:hypothetical protein
MSIYAVMTLVSLLAVSPSTVTVTAKSKGIKRYPSKYDVPLNNVE